MFRCAISAIRTVRTLPFKFYNTPTVISQETKTYSTLCSRTNFKPYGYGPGPTRPLVNNKQILDISKNLVIPVRTVTKFSLKKGRRKTVKAAVKRFFRLHWGGWIRTKIGRHKKLWKKSLAQKRRLRQHVFVNATQNTLLDKMVTKYWKKPKYYVDDPYTPYHTREEFHITRKKPRETY